MVRRESFKAENRQLFLRGWKRQLFFRGWKRQLFFRGRKRQRFPWVKSWRATGWRISTCEIVAGPGGSCFLRLCSVAFHVLCCVFRVVQRGVSERQLFFLNQWCFAAWCFKTAVVFLVVLFQLSIYLLSQHVFL